MLGLTFAKVTLHPWHVAWRFDPSELWRVVRGHPGAFALFALAEALVLPLRALAWGQVLPPGAPCRLGQRYRAVALGGLANNVLPARSGELVRALSLSGAQPELGRTRSLCSLALTKVGELAALLTYLAMAPLLVHLTGHLAARLRLAALVGAALLTLLLGLALLLTRARGRTHRLEEALRHLPKGLGRKLAVGLEELAHAVAACGTWRRMASAYALSLGVVGATVLAFTLGLAGVGAGASVGAAIVLMVAVNLGMSIPSSPSGVGVYHLVCLYALTALGVGAAPAAAFALATHLLSVLVNVGLGAVELARGHLSLSALLGGGGPVGEAAGHP